MKTLFALCLWLLAASVCYGQADTLIYLNKDFEEVPQNQADYYRVRRELDANTGRGYQKDFYITGEKLDEINYSKIDSVHDGWSLAWYKNGQLKNRSFYVKGREEGKSEAWFEDGNLKWELHYKNGKLHDTIRTFHSNQQLKRLDIFANGELVEGQCYDDKGAKVAHHPFESMPEFPGGQGAMFRFLSGRMQVPKDMRKSRQNGHVVMSFIVEADGSIGRIKVVKTTHQSLAENAKRVIQAMPRWKAGVQDGEKVAVKYTLPYRIMVE